MASRVPDQELKKAFSELQEKMIDTKRKLKIADGQMFSLFTIERRLQLTIDEMETLKPSTKTYQPVGRMFLLDDIESIKTGLEKRAKTAREMMESVDVAKGHFQKSLMESENNLREMVQQRQSKEASG